MKIESIKNTFRIIAVLEGLSYIFLLIAVPIKYLANNEQYVKALGMPHGILFILYIKWKPVMRKYANAENNAVYAVAIPPSLGK